MDPEKIFRNVCRDRSEKELVRGDIIRLKAGDFVPADFKVAEGNVEVHQSSLTGESQMIEEKANNDPIKVLLMTKFWPRS